MEMHCPIYGSQEEQPYEAPSVFDHAEIVPSILDVSYWSGKFARGGGVPLQRDVTREIHNLANLEDPQAYSYDVENDSEGPYPETSVPTSSFSKVLQSYKDKGYTLTVEEVARLVDGACPKHHGIDFSTYENLFCSAFTPYITLGPRNKLEMSKYLLNVNQSLQIRTVFDEVGDGSCLFKCIDYCLEGAYHFDDQTSDEDQEHIVGAHIHAIRKRFADAILSRLDVALASSIVEAETLMQSVVSTHDFELRYGNQFVDMAEDDFVALFTAAHNPANLSESDLRQVHRDKCFFIDVACHVSLFRHWLSSSEESSVANMEHYQIAKQCGTKGFLLPPGYLNKSSQGGQYELTLVPKLYGRQIILIDLDEHVHKAGVGLRCARTQTPAYLAPGSILQVLSALSVYTCAETNLAIQSMSACTQGCLGPMILMRCEGHYTVQSPVDTGRRLAAALRASAVYRRVMLLYEERRNYLRRIYRKCPIFDNAILNNDGPLLALVQSYLTPRQCIIVSFLSYELAIYQMVFCNLLLRVPVHASFYVTSLQAKLDHISSRTVIESAVVVVAKRPSKS